jgi:hypothetical protein
MTKQMLLESAAKLTQPSREAAVEFDQKQIKLADALNKTMGSRPDLGRLIGEGNRSMMEDNSRNFCRFMSTLFSAYEPLVLVETALWVFRAYRSHGFQTTYWPANIDTFVQQARSELSPETFEALYPFFNWLIVNIPAFVKITDQQLEMPLGEVPAHD